MTASLEEVSIAVFDTGMDIVSVPVDKLVMVDGSVVIAVVICEVAVLVGGGVTMTIMYSTLVLPSVPTVYVVIVDVVALVIPLVMYEVITF